jgi:hypothetical protein
VRLEFLPPYSPELQPAEHLWPLTNESIANRHFATLAELDAALAARCLALCDRPETVRDHTRFHWWPEATRVHGSPGNGIRLPTTPSNPSPRVQYSFTVGSWKEVG